MVHPIKISEQLKINKTGQYSFCHLHFINTNFLVSSDFGMWQNVYFSPGRLAQVQCADYNRCAIDN